MARGGTRPGAGRPKGAATKFAGSSPDLAALVAPPAATDIPEGDENDPDYLLGLVQRGFPALPDGRPITREMVWAAKERLNYHKPKRATTTEKQGDAKPLPELTDAQLKQIIADEIAARTGGSGAAGTPGGASGLPDVLPAIPPPARNRASEASQAALLEIATGRDG